MSKRTAYPLEILRMLVDRASLREALTVTARDAAVLHTPVDEERLLDGFVAEFVAESASLEGNEANGRVHTNTIENFWSCVKRTLHGTYIAVRPFHLNAYLGEQVFRFNGREGNDADRFVAALKGTDGKRVTYAALTAPHPRWRLRPGRAARELAQEPISGKSDRI